MERGAAVLLLEAGERDANPAVHDPARAHELWLSEVDWASETVPQAHAFGRRLAWPRGRVLGGSSCLNAMIWVRGAPDDFDPWAYLGADGWSWEDVLPVFERIEQRDSGGPGTVKVLTRSNRTPPRSIADAAQESASLQRRLQRTSQDGVAFMHHNIQDGGRHTRRRHTSVPSRPPRTRARDRASRGAGCSTAPAASAWNGRETAGLTRPGRADVVSAERSARPSCSFSQG